MDLGGVPPRVVDVDAARRIRVRRKSDHGTILCLDVPNLVAAMAARARVVDVDRGLIAMRLPDVLRVRPYTRPVHPSVACELGTGTSAASRPTIAAAGATATATATAPTTVSAAGGPASPLLVVASTRTATALPSSFHLLCH